MIETKDPFVFLGLKTRFRCCALLPQWVGDFLSVLLDCLVLLTASGDAVSILAALCNLTSQGRPDPPL